eukprot:UN05110
MGNDPSKIVLNTRWTPEELSQFMLSMNLKQTKLIFGNQKRCTKNNLHDLLEDTVLLYLLNVNVKLIKDAKVEHVRDELDKYKKQGLIRQETEAIEKFILENKMKGDYMDIELADYADVIGTWTQQFKSTMDTL